MVFPPVSETPRLNKVRISPRSVWNAYVKSQCQLGALVKNEHSLTRRPLVNAGLSCWSSAPGLVSSLIT